MPVAVVRCPWRHRWLKCCATVVALTLAWSLPPIAAHGATATSSANPSADTFVSASNPAGNFGGAGALEVSGAGTSKGEFQSLLKFDLSASKSSFDAALGAGQWQVQSATLQLTTANPSPQPAFNANIAGQFAIGWMQNDA